MRPVIATVGVSSPFAVLERPYTLKSKDRKPAAAGAKVRIEHVRAGNPSHQTHPTAMVNNAGLADIDEDGLLEHTGETDHMWLAPCMADLFVEFELPTTVPLACVQLWNFNAPWQTTNGLRRADIKVSEDGTTWKTLAVGAQFSEATGDADYDEPSVVQLNGAPARRVRFENLVPFGTSGVVGLSEVVFREAPLARAAPVKPEDGSTAVSPKGTLFEWSPLPDASEYSLYVGTSAQTLRRVARTNQTRIKLAALHPDATYWWRVDAVPARGRVVQGRAARFETTGLVARWTFDETEGLQAADASGKGHVARIKGPIKWAPGQGRFGGGAEFDGAKGYLECRGSPLFDFRNEMTVSLWVRVRQFDRADQALLAQAGNAWRLQRRGEEDTVQFVVTGPKPDDGSKTNQVRLVSKRSINDGQWHHVAAAYDGQQATLYLDGVGEDSVAASGRIAGGAGGPITMGQNPSAGRRYFNGWMDEVRLYGCGLGTEEVMRLYRDGAN